RALGVGGGDRVAPGERADRHALELEHCLVGEALCERVPVTGANALVVTGDVLVEEVDARSEPEVLPDDPVQDSVGPAAVPAVGLPPHALADEARSLGVPNGALVEAVDLELQSMEAELEEQVALEEPRRLVREPLPPELRVDPQ